MHSLNRRILLYLLIIWGGLVTVGAIGYGRLNAVQDVSRNLIEGAYPSAQAALQVENAIHRAYQNTYAYCALPQDAVPEAKTETQTALSQAKHALEIYLSLSEMANPDLDHTLRALLKNVQTHALDCLSMTDEGMTPEEFSTHIPELENIQMDLIVALREAAFVEQQKMLAGAEDIHRVTEDSLVLFVIGTLALSLITLGVGYLLSRSVLPPVAALTRAASRFSARDLSVRADENFPGEFGALSHTFNSMADHIQNTLQENTHLLETIRESREKFRDLYDHAPDVYHSLASDRTILEINNTELSWLGYTRDEVVGRLKLDDMIAEESLKSIQKSCNDLHSGSEDLELTFKRKDGTTFPGLVNCAGVFDDQGSFLHKRCTVRDISSEKELRAQLLQAQKLESLGTLSGGIAHDFNNLLTSMMGFSQLAMLGIKPESQTYQNLDQVVKLGNQAAGLTRQLLTFSRQTPMEKNSVFLAPLAKETAKVLERTLPETIRVETRIPTQTAAVEADATQIQQVLMNLCVNARDAMGDGGVLTICLQDIHLDPETAKRQGNRTPGPYICLSIQDTGPGIPPEVQKRMFEPFFTTKEVGKGTGLGLSIVHGIVESHGGHIQLFTEQNQGTEFQIYLPATDSDQTEKAGQLDVPGGTETLLLVEDDTHVRDSLEKTLTGKGYRVLSAGDGSEALDLYLSHTPIDLVVSDVVMPGIGGVDFCLQLARCNPDVKVLLISGYNPNEQNLEVLPDGLVADYLQKPFAPRILARTVRNILDKLSVPA